MVKDHPDLLDILYIFVLGLYSVYCSNIGHFSTNKPIIWKLKWSEKSKYAQNYQFIFFFKKKSPICPFSSPIWENFVT